MKYVTLENVIDIRTNKLHSVAVVEERKAKYFVSAGEEQEAEDEDLT